MFGSVSLLLRAEQTRRLWVSYTDNLFHVQLCDLAGIARELASDADRIVPGDGDIQVAPLIEQLKAINYRGPVSMELMNHQIWQMSPRTFGEIAMTALRKILGQAAMD